jgi:hypothetical protein
LAWIAIPDAPEAECSVRFIDNSPHQVEGKIGMMNIYLLLSCAVLAIHATFILWVIFGWLSTARRRLLQWAHLFSVGYCIFIETSGLTCPLTLIEQALERRAGVRAYRHSFMLHYLELLVYPNIPPLLLTVCAVGVCLGIIGIYVFRWRSQRRSA